MDLKCHALENWKACCSALTSGVQSYLAACADLRIVYAQTQCLSRAQREAESVLLAVDAELANLASEEEALRKARISLSTLRNTSSVLAPVHALPPEILVPIFLIAQKPRRSTYDRNRPVSLCTLSAVSSHWRYITINTPCLWTNIKIWTTQKSYEYASLILQRSNGLPVRLSLSSGRDLGNRNNRQAEQQWRKLLGGASQQIHTLSLFEDVDSPAPFVYSALGHLLYHDSPGLIVLRARKPDDPNCTDLSPLFKKNSNTALRGVTVLQLENVLIPWTSAAYHNLIDLRLEMHSNEVIEISMLQLADVLAASPGLTTLKLEGLDIVYSENWDRERVVRPAYLEVLYLAHLDYYSLEAFVSAISLSNCQSDMEIGIHWAGDDSFDVLDLLDDFLHGVRIRTLAHSPIDESDSPQEILSVSRRTPSLENLILFSHDFLQLSESEMMEDKLGEDLNTPPHLPHLFLVRSKLSLEKLKLIVEIYGVETLHLEGQWMGSIGAPSQSRGASSEEVQPRLLEAFPSLSCVVSSEVTVRDWPCCTTFN